MICKDKEKGNENQVVKLNPVNLKSIFRAELYNQFQLMHYSKHLIDLYHNL